MGNEEMNEQRRDIKFFLLPSRSPTKGPTSSNGKSKDASTRQVGRVVCTVDREGQIVGVCMGMYCEYVHANWVSIVLYCLEYYLLYSLCSSVFCILSVSFLCSFCALSVFFCIFCIPSVPLLYPFSYPFSHPLLSLPYR